MTDRPTPDPRTIPRTTTTITRVDGSTVDVEHVDHAAVLDVWDDLGNRAWTLEVGDLHNVIDEAKTQRDAARAALQRAEDSVIHWARMAESQAAALQRVTDALKENECPVGLSDASMVGWNFAVAAFKNALGGAALVGDDD